MTPLRREAPLAANRAPAAEERQGPTQAEFAEAETKSATEIKSLKGEIAEFKSSARTVEVSGVVEKAIESGRCLPANKDEQIRMGTALHGVDFTDGEANPFEDWKKSLTEGPKVIEFEEKIKDGHTGNADDLMSMNG